MSLRLLPRTNESTTGLVNGSVTLAGVAGFGMLTPNVPGMRQVLTGTRGVTPMVRSPPWTTNLPGSGPMPPAASRETTTACAAPVAMARVRPSWMSSATRWAV